MLNATQTAAAEAALEYPARDLPRDERVEAHRKYREAQQAILAQFGQYLANTYLAEFSTKVQDAVWNKVLEDGGGYENMEYMYEEIADILKLV